MSSYMNNWKILVYKVAIIVSWPNVWVVFKKRELFKGFQKNFGNLFWSSGGIINSISGSVDKAHMLSIYKASYIQEHLQSN